jgi:hypothetical protein
VRPRLQLGASGRPLNSTVRRPRAESVLVKAIPILIALVLLLLILGLFWWGVRTCRALWRRGTTPWGRLVYNHGVRGFGVMLAVTLSLFAGYSAYIGADSLHEALWIGLISGGLVAIFITPACLGLGYIWGTWMAFFVGLEPDAKPTQSSRAPNNRWRGP